MSTALDPYFRSSRAYTPTESLVAPLPETTRFELAHLYTKTVLRGTRSDAERNTRAVAAVAAGAAVGAAAAIVALKVARAER